MRNVIGTLPADLRANLNNALRPILDGGYISTPMYSGSDPHPEMAPASPITHDLVLDELKEANS